jgi:single-strand DNA-binding protein
MNSGFGDKKTTTWIRCSMWGDRGVKLAPYLLKGGLVGVSGEFSAREYEKDGFTKTSCELRVNDVTLLGSPDRAKYEKPPAQAPAAKAAVEDFEDDIPF